MAVRIRASRITKVLLFAMACAVLAMLGGGCASSGSGATEPQAEPSTPDGTATGETPETEGPSASVSPPVLPSPETIQGVLQPWLGEGAVAVDWEYSNDEQRTYILPPGSFGADAMDEPVLTINAYRYSDDLRFVSGVYDVEREYGGSTPEAVYGSAVVKIRDVGAATNWGESPREYPEVASGMVTNERNEMILAGDGDHWYQALISGVIGDVAFNDALVGLGRLLAE